MAAAEEVGGIRGGGPIVAAGFVIMLVSGVLWSSFALFLVALEQDFGWSRSEISLGFTVFTLVNASTSPLVGLAIRRLDARLVLGALSCILALGLAAASQVTTPWQFYLCFGLLCGVGAQSCSSFSLFTILGNWFRGRSTALSIADSGSGVGTFLGLPLLLAVMESHGWRGGYLVMAAAIAMIVLPLNLWFMRFQPPIANAVTPGPALAARQGRRMVLDRTLLLMAGAFFFGPFAYHALVTQQIALFHDVGIEVGLAVWIASAVGLATFLTRLASGWLLDVLGERTVMAMALVGAVLTIACLASLSWSQDALIPYAYPALLAVGFGAQAIILAAGTRRLVPGTDFAIVYGSMRIFGGFGMAVGPIAAATVFDLSGTYDLALLVIAGAAIGQYLAFTSAMKPREAATG